MHGNVTQIKGTIHFLVFAKLGLVTRMKHAIASSKQKLATSRLGGITSIFLIANEKT